MTRSVSFILALLLLVACVRGEDVNVEFRVKAPATTPKDAKLYLSGDAKPLGEWSGAGVELKRDDTGVYVATVALAKDQPIEFKITRGSWETVEKNADGSERDNRKLTPKSNEKAEIEVATWADQAGAAPATKPSTKSGDVRVQRITSRILNNERNLWIYLPPGYEQSSERYPVFYLHDGRNLFDAATSFAGEWQADETAERLIKEKKIPPLILVGIENNAQRMAEYTPGRGALYERFVVEEVKPFIDSTYRTITDCEHTAAGGSSLGGLISLYLVKDHPDVFGACAAISPALQWNNGAAFKDLAADPTWMKRTRFWIDMGTDESMDQPAKNVANVKQLAALLSSNGLVADTDFRLLIVDGAKHNEAAWAKRFDQVLIFLFGSVQSR